MARYIETTKLFTMQTNGDIEKKMTNAPLPQVVLVARSTELDELIQLCADGKLPFSGPDSLCAKVSAMGYKTTSLHEMVVNRKAST